MLDVKTKTIQTFYSNVINVLVNKDEVVLVFGQFPLIEDEVLPVVRITIQKRFAEKVTDAIKASIKNFDMGKFNTKSGMIKDVDHDKSYG